ncbi:MAG: hypothetical protein U0104_09110 [Gemmatimonadales bacterium]
MKTIVTYTLMVGVPLAGVGAALRAGRTLEAPPAIGGAWTPTAAPDVAACPALARLGGLRDVWIAQSGAAVTLVLRGKQGSTRLTGGLDPDTPGAVVRSVRAAGDGLTLRASVPGSRASDSMRVSLEGADCAGTTAFSAFRVQAPSAGRGEARR